MNGSFEGEELMSEASKKQDFEIEIGDAFRNVSIQLSQLIDKLSTPIMRIQHALTIWDRGEDGQIDVLRVHKLLERVRTELLEGEKIVRHEMLEAECDCLETAEKINEKLVYCSGHLEGMVQMVSGLQHDVVSLKNERDSRIQEHSPSSPDLRAKVLSLTGGKCAYCDSEITSDADDGKANFVIEHVVPKSCGGPDHFSNYVPACSKCNAHKSAGHVLEFIQRRLIGARVEIAEAAE